MGSAVFTHPPPRLQYYLTLAVDVECKLCCYRFIKYECKPCYYFSYMHLTLTLFDPYCSLSPLSIPDKLLSPLSCLPKFQWFPYPPPTPPPSFPVFFTPSPPSPLPHSGPCHCLFAVEVRVVHNYVIHRDLDETRLRTHTSTARERQRWDVGHAMLLCTPLRQTHTHSHPPTPTPPLCSSRTATRKCKRTGSAGAHCKFTAHNQHRGQWAKKQINKRDIYKERGKSTLLCLQVCEALKRKIKQTGEQRGKIEKKHNTPILQLYCHCACFA